jgi:hypothetical protein
MAISPNIKSYTGKLGNTWYWTGGGQKNADNTGWGIGALAFDAGSDGKLDAGFVGAIGNDSKGAWGGLAGTGQTGWFSKGWGLPTNGKLQEIWSHFLPYK